MLNINFVTLRSKLITFCLLFSAFSVNAESELSKQHQIMAGFLLHFTSFTRWQAAEDNRINLCVLGPEPFKAYIQKMIKRRPKNSKGKAIVLNHITPTNKAQLTKCQIIYAQPEHYQELWENVPPGQNTLLVSQSKTFIEQGGMINFVLQDKKVNLEVNLPAVQQAQLKISSKLLKHAKVIKGSTRNQLFEKVMTNAHY